MGGPFDPDVDYEIVEGFGALPTGDGFKLRAPVMDFAREMERKLRKNDHKGGWKDLPISALMKHLAIEYDEFQLAREFYGIDAARGELVDVANYLMMIWDRLGSEQK